MFQEAYDVDHLTDLLDANSSAPAWVADEEVVERIVNHARSRADARGEDSAYDHKKTPCIITTNWSSFTDDWGFDDGNANQVALGQFNEDVSAGKNADLFNNTVILQSGWLRSGDDRRTHAEHYQAEADGSYEPSAGEMWVPNGAQDYICIKELTAELLHGEPNLADAM